MRQISPAESVNALEIPSQTTENSHAKQSQNRDLRQIRPNPAEQMANTSQDSDSSQAQAIPPIVEPVKQRKSNKPPVVKAAVLLSRANGTSKSQIARDLDISRPTVDVIIEEADLDRQLDAGTLLSSTLIPKAVQAVEKTLDKGDGVLGLNFLKWQLGENPNSKNGQQQALNAVFSGCQVLIQQATASTLHKDAAQPSTNNEQPIAQVTDNKTDR